MFNSQPKIEDRFHALVEEHGDKIFNLAMMRSNRLDLAQDISQETFIRAYKGLAKFRDDSQISTWLYRIALNVCHSLLAKEGLRTHQSIGPDGDFTEIEDHGDSVEQLHLNDFRGEQIRKAVSDLPQQQSEAITLYYLKEFQYSEVAEIMDIPLNTVKSHLRRAKANLRLTLAEMSTI